MVSRRLNSPVRQGPSRYAGGWLCVVALLCWACVATAWAQHASHGAAASQRRASPSLAVGAAFAPDGVLWVVGLNQARRLFVQHSTDTGQTWAPPRLLDIGTDVVSADGENRPKIAFGPSGQAVITYTQPLSRPYTGEIRMLRSGDGGRSFSAPFTVHRDRQLITHRFESVAFDAQGVLHTVWVDKRDLEALKAKGAGSAREAPTPQAAPPAGATGSTRNRGPSTAYRGAAIYRNESRDGGQTFGPDLKVADHSCECCRIALAPTPAGGLAALWRHVFEPNERDHAFVTFGGGPLGRDETAAGQALANAPLRAPVHALVRATWDRWALDACPHHGPGLALAAGGGYHAVWFGIRGGVPAVRYGRLDAQGEPVGEVQVLPDVSAEHADVASAGQRTAIVWRSFDGDATRLRAWVSGDDGRSFQLRELARSVEDNDHPRLVRRDQEVFAVWRTSREVRVERVLP